AHRMRILALCVLVACGGTERPEPLKLQVACFGWAPGPRCFVGDEVSLVVRSSQAPSAPNDVEWTRSGGSFITRTTLTETLTVRVNDREATLVAVTDPRGVLDEARAHRTAGDYEAARADLAPLLDHERPLVRALSRGELGRVALREGEHEEALQALTTASRALRQLGELGLARNDIVAASWVARERLWRLDLSAALAAEAIQHDDDIGAAVRSRYHRGSTAYQRGDLRSAATDLQAAATEARRIRLDVVAVHAEHLLAEVLFALGREAEAFRVVREQPLHDKDCAEGSHYIELSSLGLRATSPPPELDGWLAKAAEDETCSTHDRAAATLNLALRALAQGRLDDARAGLTRARSFDDGAVIEEWSLDIEGRADLEAGRAADALAHFRELRDRAASAQAMDAQWRGALGVARSLRALGRLEDAADAYEATEGITEALLVEVALEGGRPGFAQRRGESARELVDVRLALGEPEAALQALRRARSRVVRGADLQQALPNARSELRREVDRHRATVLADAGPVWGMTLEQLQTFEREHAGARASLRESIDALVRQAGIARFRPRPLRAGEGLVAIHQGRGGVTLFVASASGTVAHSLSALPTTSAELWAEVLRHRESTRWRLLLGGLAEDLDAHASPRLGEASAVYTLDLEAVEDPGPVRTAALWVPAGANLEGARQESAAVRAHFSERRIVSTVEEGFAEASVLHFAGHGRPAGGAIELEDQTLTTFEILARERVPRVVVLNGCDTASGEMSVAHAFVLAGASSVLASDQPVADEVASAVGLAVLAANYDLDAVSRRLREPGRERFRVFTR
ncbi:MAG: CHAT domain-containing protein, partial [Myxococcota bacterium]